MSNNAVSLDELNTALTKATQLNRPRVARAISEVSGTLALDALFDMVNNRNVHAEAIDAFLSNNAISLRPFPTNAFKKNAFIVNPLNIALGRAVELNRPRIAAVLRRHGAQ